MDQCRFRRVTRFLSVIHLALTGLLLITIVCLASFAIYVSAHDEGEFEGVKVWIETIEPAALKETTSASLWSFVAFLAICTVFPAILGYKLFKATDIREDPKKGLSRTEFVESTLLLVIVFVCFTFVFKQRFSDLLMLPVHTLPSYFVVRKYAKELKHIVNGHPHRPQSEANGVDPVELKNLKEDEKV